MFTASCKCASSTKPETVTYLPFSRLQHVPHWVSQPCAPGQAIHMPARRAVHPSLAGGLESCHLSYPCNKAGLPDWSSEAYLTLIPLSMLLPDF